MNQDSKKIRLIPWFKFNKNEFRRSYIFKGLDEDIKIDIVRVWASIDNGVTHWKCNIINTFNLTRIIDLVIINELLADPFIKQNSFNRKSDALKAFDSVLIKHGFLLLKDKHASFL